MILMKDIIREGHPTLTKKAENVNIPLSQADKLLLARLMEFVKNSQDEELAEKYGLRAGVGIAAPQVNVSKRMFVIHTEDLDGKLYSYALVNPKILKKSNSLIYLPGGEGCLSVDRETEGLTPRYESISIEAHSYDIETDTLRLITLHLTGYIAIVFQHEYDHLEGILFTQKLFNELPHAKPAFIISES